MVVETLSVLACLVTSGTANTGGGAGGGRANGGSTISGGGGSGVVVLRMNTSDFSGTTSGSPTISAIGSETILQYLASGSYIHNPSTAAGQMNYMVLAGGASGGSNGGGGGSGGLRSSWYASGGGASWRNTSNLIKWNIYNYNWWWWCRNYSLPKRR